MIETGSVYLAFVVYLGDLRADPGERQHDEEYPQHDVRTVVQRA